MSRGCVLWVNGENGRHIGRNKDQEMDDDAAIMSYEITNMY